MRAKSEIKDPEINLTPLLDVVFVVLIAFILVAPLLDKDQVQLAPSGHSASHMPLSMKDASPIQIHVRADNSIMFNNVPSSLETLPRKLAEAKLRFPHQKPQILHDRRAHFGTYQSIKNCVEQAGFEEMDIVLAPS